MSVLSNPSTLPVSGTPACIQILYEIFLKDFRSGQVNHDGKAVKYDDTKKPNEDKIEYFWHLVTKDKCCDLRIYDQLRAERLHWARPMMEASHGVPLIIFDYVEGPSIKGTRRYIWFREHKYVVIMVNKKMCFHWVTAFHVDKFKEVDLLKKQADGQRHRPA